MADAYQSLVICGRCGEPLTTNAGRIEYRDGVAVCYPYCAKTIATLPEPHPYVKQLDRPTRIRRDDALHLNIRELPRIAGGQPRSSFGWCTLRLARHQLSQCWLRH